MLFDRHSHYAICDPAHVVATWENNGHGWTLKTNSGPVSAARHPECIPTEGDFKLVELRLVATPDDFHLADVLVYQLAKRWALVHLGRSDEQILAAVTGRGPLNKEQKNAVRKHLHERFMGDVLVKSSRVMAYLCNTDYHSHGTDAAAEGETAKTPGIATTTPELPPANLLSSS